MAFKSKECRIPTVWCGDGEEWPASKKGDEIRYYRVGTRSECMKKGFGAGAASERSKYLPKSSLQNIRYVGAKYETNFGDNGIQTISHLRHYAKHHTREELDGLLREVYKKSNTGAFDTRAYNSTLLFLRKNGTSRSRLPRCHTIPPP